MGNKVKRDPFWDEALSDEQVVELHRIENPRSAADELAGTAARLFARMQDDIETLMDAALTQDTKPLASIAMKMHRTNELYRRLIVETLAEQADKLSKTNGKNAMPADITQELYEDELRYMEEEFGVGNVTNGMLCERLNCSRQTLWRLKKKGLIRPV